MKRVVACFLAAVSTAFAGWLDSPSPLVVIEHHTATTELKTGDESGTLTKTGAGLEFVGDNVGEATLSGSGAEFRGSNEGVVEIGGVGATVRGHVSALATATNLGTGAVLLVNLSAGQRAEISELGDAAIVLGAGIASNAQCIVVGDGNESHGPRTVTADAFYGAGTGLVEIPVAAIDASGRAPGRFLRGDGVWAQPGSPFVVVEQGETSVVYVVTSSGHTNLIGSFHSE